MSTNLVEKVKILVVDDAMDTLEMINRNLSSKGYFVFTASSVVEATHILKSSPVDLVITDLKMPGLDGMDLLTDCRAKRPDLPIVMISAFGTVDAAVNAIKRGAYDFITKPVDETELLNVVNKALAECGSNKEMVSDFFKDDSGFSAEFIKRSLSRWE